MTTYTIASGYDASIISLSPTVNTGTNAVVFVGTSGLIGLLYVPLPADIAGKVIASATLTGVVQNATYPALTGKVHPITSPWAESTVTWNRQPTIGSATNTAVSAGVQGTAVNLDCTAIVQAAASGAAWYGLALDTLTSGLTFYSFDSGLPAWTLTINTTEAPEQPQSLVPNGTVVSSGAPVLTCDFTDNGGLSSDMAAMNVQISTTTSFTSPVYNQTGTTTYPVFDLANPPTGATAFTPITSGQTRWWRVRVQDTDGNWSAFSDPVSFTYTPLPTLTLLTPAAGVLWDPTSDIVASTSANMASYRVQVTDGDDRTAVRFDTGRVPANPSALTTIDEPLPQKYGGSRVLVDDSTYQLHIRAWDTVANRQSTPGAPAYMESWTTFHFDDDLTQTPIASITADQPSQGPAVQLTWTRAAAADGWVILRNGKVINRSDGTDLITGPSTYSWSDPLPSQWVEHTYSVRALTLVSGTYKRSPAGPTVTIIPAAEGLWLTTADGDQVVLYGDPSGGTGVDQFTVTDRRVTYKPINRRYDVDIVQALEGLSGTFAGTISEEPDGDQTVDDAVRILLSIKGKPAEEVTLTYGRFSGQVLLRNVQVTPHPLGNAVNQMMRVQFGVNQTGDFDSVV